VTEQILIELIKQGGFALLAGIIFFVYRADQKANAKALLDAHERQLKQIAEISQRQTESATAWMQFGKEQGALMERIASTLERIETKQAETTTCPVTQVTTEALREAVSSGRPVPGRPRVDHIVAQAVRAAIRSEAAAPRESA